MSWQAYVDSSLVGSGHVDKAAIFDITGRSVWAASPGYTISPAEMQAVTAAFNDPTDPKKVYGTGFHLAGVKYNCIKADDRSLYGRHEKTGMIIVKTKQAMLVAHHGEETASTNAAATVEKLADYMISVGY